MDWLLNLDKAVFTFVNSNLSNSFFDVFLVFLTDFNRTQFFVWGFIPLVIALLLGVSRVKGLVIVSGLSLTLAMNDYFGGKIIKPIFERLRPVAFEKTAENVEGFKVILRTPYHGGFSFISNHAANVFCAAIFLSYFYPKAKIPLYLIAVLVALSRVYVGVHYPSDVIFGALLGTFFGWAGSRSLGRVKAWQK